MPFNDKKETLKDETYCIGTLSIDGETIEIFGGFKKEQLELSLLLEELIYTLKKWGETWES